MRNLTTSEIIGGLFIGAVLFLILTRKSESQQFNDLRQSNVGINNWKSLDYVEDFDEFNSRLIQSLKPVIKSETQNVEQVSKEVEQTSKEVEQTSNNETEYKNKEVWKIGRNQDGDIETIEVERNAKVS
jgi:hypothetical protein